MILCPRITLGIYQTFNWAMVSHGLEHIMSQVDRAAQGIVESRQNEPLHLKTFIDIGMSSYSQLGRIQHHITAVYTVDTTSQCIHNASTMVTQGFHNAYTAYTSDTTSVEIQNNRI